MTSELKVLKQGAEAKLYMCNYLGKPALIKERFAKGYRHPVLDLTITKERMKNEARGITRSMTAGILTPTLYLIDFDRRRIYMEYFEQNITVKDYLSNLSKYSPGEETEGLNVIAKMVGVTVGKLHNNNIVHGDLTTSNMLLVQKNDTEGNWIEKRDFELAFIDFGLAAIDTTVEDRAVDLYVMERSFISTHSDLPKLLDLVMAAYKDNNKFNLTEVMARYQLVRERGRKRVMIG